MYAAGVMMTERLPRLKSMAEVGLQIGGRLLWVDLERDGLHQVYLPRYAMYDCFQPGFMEGSGQLLNGTATQ